ncbi:MAG: helix-turn-helix domain-containing protein [Methyloligellaceae bacterium]
MSRNSTEDQAPKIGGKIRQLRRQRGMSQAQLAGELAISASYLNLLEHNRRKITVPLLLKLAQKFGLEISDLSDSDEARLSGDLMEMFSDQMFGEVDITNHEVRELANSSPTIARSMLQLYDSYRSSLNDFSLTQASNFPKHELLASEQISDFLQANANYFSELEEVAARVRSNLDPSAQSSFESMSSYILNVFGVRTSIGPLPENMNQRISEGGEKFTISETLPWESRLFHLATAIARVSAKPEIDKLVEKAGFSHEEIEKLARKNLASYVAGALIMPYEIFHTTAREMRYDLERLAQRFGVSFEQACHRLTTLQKPGMTGIPFHLIRTDIAGNVSKRFSMSGIQIPRHGGACPRWNVYEAFLQPGRIMIQISEMPDGNRYFCIARTMTKGENRHNASLRHLSIGLGCDLSYAKQLVYSDGLDVDNPTKVVPIGVSCRICPRKDCSVRAFPGLIA